jgi:ubiquinone/menaquinone biosynthesis C-methylase UbiE
MKTSRDLYNDWASHYDQNLADGTAPVSFEGYEDVLNEAVKQARVVSGMSVLDLGTGTGNLAGRFIDEGCDVWGMDFSENMLAKAREKLPCLHAVLADLGDESWVHSLSRRFDRIVSAYAWHEFDLAYKLKLLKQLTGDFLSEAGRVVIADIAYPDQKARAQAGKHWGLLWGEAEHYWAADETIAACNNTGLNCSYKQVSNCAGVFVMENPGL